MLDPKTIESWKMMSRITRCTIIAALVLIPVLLVGVVWLSRNLYGPGELAPESVSVSTNSGIVLSPADPFNAKDDMEQPMSLAERAILDTHFAAIGGVQRLASINSSRMKGRMVLQNGEEQVISVLKKAGDRVRITIKSPTMQRVASVTSSDSWYAVWKTGNLLLLEDMDPGEQAAIRQYAGLKSELFQARENSWNVRYVGYVEFNHRMTYAFDVDDDSKRRMRFFIDAETYLDIGREDRDLQENGQLAITQSLMEDHFDSSGYAVPGKISTWKDDQLVQTLYVDEMEMNPGILDSIFARPVEPVLSMLP